MFFPLSCLDPVLPFTLHNLFTRPMLLFSRSIQLPQSFASSEFVNKECDMQSPRVIHSRFCVGFHNDL